MNIRDLKYLTLVNKYKHFGKAATMGNISQPALSMQVKKVEDELGVNIFERSNKKVFTTEVGMKIIKIAEDVLMKINNIEEIASEFKNPFTGNLVIGAFPTLAPYFFPHIVPHISTNYPKLKLFLVEEKTDMIIDQLLKGEIDMALLALPLKNKDFEIEPVFTDKFFLAVPKNHKFSKRRIISQDELKNQKLLLLDEGHCLRDQALNLCDTIGAIENQSFRASSLETLRQMVVAGAGITLIPEIALNDNKFITYIPFDKPNPTREIALAWRKGSSRQECFRKILELIKPLVGF